jgi:hypothetical protein
MKTYISFFNKKKEISRFARNFLKNKENSCFAGLIFVFSYYNSGLYLKDEKSAIKKEKTT